MSKGIGLIGGMALFALLVLALLAWLMFGDVAGKQRGLVFENRTDAELVLHLDEGPTTQFAPDDVRTIPVKPEAFPQEFVVTDEEGTALYRREFVFEELQDYAFYIVLGADEFLLYTDPGED